MENNSGAQLDANGLDLGDYMDVVTTYKCRFCSFTSSTPQGISYHVKNIHIQQPTQQKTETIQINNRKIPIDTTLTVDMETGCVQIQPLSQNDLDNNKVEVISEHASLTNFNVLESLDELSSASASEKAPVITALQSSESVSMSVEAFSSSHEAARSTENNLSNSSFNIETVPSVSSGRQGNTDGSIATQTVDDDSQSSFILDDKVSSESTQNQPPITKELFLCGQCSVGYSSIEECKTHMVEDHGIQMEDPIDSNIKISVGTQVENTAKRPGRKKKSEVAAENVQEEKSQIEQFSDSDWEADKDDYYIGSRSRRKIRRPKALTDGYYMPKGKRKVTYTEDGEIEDEENSPAPIYQKVKRPRAEIVEKYEEKCSVVGCYAKFKTKESLEIHTKCHVEKSHNFMCPSCNEIFSNWRTVRFHMWKLHKIDTDLFECDICHDFKTDTMSKLLVHKEIHSENRPYTCHVCGKGFRQYSQMKNHEAIHSNEDTTRGPEPAKHKRQCDICKRVFATQKCMMVHVEEVHGKNKPFKCSYCGYATSRKAMLISHERTHTKEKPFKCEVCSFATGDHNSLRRHTMRHTGQRLYKCSCCPYTCIQAISIKMHMKNKHPNAPGIFCCNECTYRTVNEQFFKNHIEDHKNGLITEKEQHSNTRSNENVQFTIQTFNENGIQLQDIIELQQNELEKTRQMIEIQLQVQTLDSGETQISAEDFAKLSNCEALGTCNMTSGQLISFILNAIAQSSGANVGNSVVQVVNGIQITVNSSASKDGVASHSVVLQIPTSEGVPISDNQVVLEPVNQLSEIPVQSLTFDDVDEAGDEENSTQSNNQQVIMTPQGEIVNFVSNATIDDLAKISCIVKDGVVFDSTGTTVATADMNELNNAL